MHLHTNCAVDDGFRAPARAGMHLEDAQEGQPSKGHPAHAGMSPDHRQRWLDHFQPPRARGDGPVAATSRRERIRVAPRMRGETTNAPASNATAPRRGRAENVRVPVMTGMTQTLRQGAPETIIGRKKSMPKDQLPLLIGIGAIIVTLATGTCSTNTRITDAVVSINQRMEDAVVSINQRMDDGFQNMNRRIDDTNKRIDDTNKRIDDLGTDVRELRSLVIEAISSETAEN